MQEYQFHPLAEVFPLIAGQEFDDLVADIKTNGLLEPIWLHPDGRILDGRNRYNACLAAGIPPTFRDWEFPGKDDRLEEELSFVVSENIRRRHMTSWQVANVVVELKPYVLEAEKKKAAERLKLSPGRPADRAEEKPCQTFDEVYSQNRTVKPPPDITQVQPPPITTSTRSVGPTDLELQKPSPQAAVRPIELCSPPKPDPNAGRALEKLAQKFGTNRQFVAEAEKSTPEQRQQAISGNRTYTEHQREKKEEKREAIREVNRELVKQAPAPVTLEAGRKFSTIVLDPPWDWGDEGDADQLGRARPTYATMSIEAISNLPVEDLAEKNAHIYLWITNRSLPKGFALLERWGFRYITTITWVKPSFGMGNYFRGSTEQILFGVRGSLPLLRNNVGTHFCASRPGEHSTKPDESYKLIESCSPGPWLEMFARTLRPGWSQWGAEVNE